MTTMSMITKCPCQIRLLVALASCVIMNASIANASVYISHESTYPSMQQQLMIQQIRANNNNAEAIRELIKSQQSVLNATLNHSTNQRRQADQALNETVNQRVGLIGDLNRINTQRAELAAEKNSLEQKRIHDVNEIKRERNFLLLGKHSAERELAKREIALAKNYNAKQLELSEREIAQSKQYDEQQLALASTRNNNVQLMTHLRNTQQLENETQRNNNAQLLSHQKTQLLASLANERTAFEQDRMAAQKADSEAFQKRQKELDLQSKDILAKQIELGAPNNVTVAKRPINVITREIPAAPKVQGVEVTEPTTVVNTVDPISFSDETAGSQSKRSVEPTATTSIITPVKEGPTKPSTMMTNLVQFVSNVVPAEWRVIAPDEIHQVRTQIIKGKDWKDIINTYAIMHPYLHFTIDPYRSRVIIDVDSEAFNVAKAPIVYWNIEKGKTLRENIEKWELRTNWDVIWKADDVDYVIEAQGQYHGQFHGKDGVLEQLLKGTQRMKNPLRAIWKTGNNVVLIVRKGAMSYE